MDTSGLNVLKLFLPSDIADYFDLVDIEETATTMVLRLEEKNLLPPGYASSDYEAKDFLAPKGVLDFPIRGKEVKLLLSMRRWRHKQTGDSIKRDWKVVMDGGLVTQEFADFLKALD